MQETSRSSAPSEIGFFGGLRARKCPKCEKHFPVVGSVEEQHCSECKVLLESVVENFTFEDFAEAIDYELNHVDDMNFATTLAFDRLVANPNYITEMKAELSEVGGAVMPGEGPKVGDGANRTVGGYRFEIGANKKPRVRKNVRQSIQNRINADRGLARRIAAAKKWHKSAAGAKYHKDLARYNQGGNRGGLYESEPDKSVDMLLDAIIRQLVVIESVDLLQDVDITDDGSLYLFFDPMLNGTQIQDILGVVQRESTTTQIVGNPENGDWWVLFAPGYRACPTEEWPENYVYPNYEIPTVPIPTDLNFNNLMLAQTGSKTPEDVVRSIDINKAVELMESAGKHDHLNERVVIEHYFAQGRYKREDLPQLDPNALVEFLGWLTQKKVTFDVGTCSGSNLIATQFDWDQKKIDALAKKPSPNHLVVAQIESCCPGAEHMRVLDGHHRWGAGLVGKDNPSEAIYRVVRINVPIEPLIKLAIQFKKEWDAEPKLWSNKQ